MASNLLSKTKYLNGLQCPKYLWMLLHEPAKVPEPNAATQHIFEQGHRVSEVAKKLFPGGVNVPTEDFMKNTWETQALVQQRVPIFEAGILAESIYARADILNPVGEDEWDIIEVKSSTSVSDVHVHDVSFQKHCYEKSGLKIRQCFLTYINREYVRVGEIDPKGLFKTEDITTAVEEASVGIQTRIDDMFEMISAEECPDIAIGKQCSHPYDCPVVSCWDFLPPNSVFDLYRGGQRPFELLENGVLTIRDIPDTFALTEKQDIQRLCEVNGKPHVDKEGINEFLKALRYPLHLLDFETFDPALPLFDGSRPYQKIPFQFSLHVVRDDVSSPEHFTFLAEGIDDPRPKLLSGLKELLGEKGSIVAYNQSFERSVLEELGQAFPDYREWLEGVCSRLVDLLIPFRSFHYYHPAQKGSASLKQVLPALTGMSYEGLGITNGQDAGIAFQQATYGDASQEQRKSVRAALEKYCGLDTEGMMRIIGKLGELAGMHPQRAYSQLNFDW